MRHLLVLVALLGAPTLALAEAPPIVKTGYPSADRLFAEVASVNAVLDAADARMDALLAEVAAPIGLPPTSPIDRSVRDIAAKAGGEVRLLVADGRPILALGAEAPAHAKRAAGALNEGTQEVGVMAADIGRLSQHLADLADRAEALALDAGALQGAGLPESKLPQVKRQVADNVARTRTAASRAKIVAARASALLDQVKVGVEASRAPAPAAASPDATTPTATPPAADTPKPAPASAEVPTVGEVVALAWERYNAGQIEAAVEQLAAADLLLPRQKSPVPRHELVELFQLRGLVNLVQGDATAAAWSVTQAQVVHPGATPPARLGKDYLRLHKAIERSGAVRQVEVRVQGEGRAYLSGNEVTGGSVVRLGQGQHLLQIERDGHWRSSVVYVREGFAVAL